MRGDRPVLHSSLKSSAHRNSPAGPQRGGGGVGVVMGTNRGGHSDGRALGCIEQVLGPVPFQAVRVSECVCVSVCV